MKKVKRSVFKGYPGLAAILLALGSPFAANVAFANAGYGVNTDLAGNTIAVPTYYASSPQGWEPALDPVTHLPQINPNTGVAYTAQEAYDANGGNTSGPVPMVDTGTALRKFVDQLAMVDSSVTLANGETRKGMPLAIPEKWVNPINGAQTSDNYFEIAVVQYPQRMHSDLAKPTLVRAYVQIETPGIVQNSLKDAAGVGSEHIALTYPDGSPLLDPKGNQVYGVHQPVYMGPIIVTSKGTAVRIKFDNYLPYTDSDGNKVGYKNGGEMPIPVDKILAGGGPLYNADGTPMLDNSGKPINFAENRALLHFHGGDTPWMSDGHPHQWTVPFGDASWDERDPSHPNGIGRGAGFVPVPDMADPGNGSQTYYYANNLSARLMFYHDHTSALTRINVYMGEAAGYVITDPVEQNLVANKVIPDTLLGLGIPLVIQDKGFLPKNVGANPTDAAGNPVQSQDAKWDLNHWGQPGDFFFPHVYEANQDPNSIDGTNPVGRWDWGPWFWPVFPAQYSLPSGDYGDVSTTPEAFMDTPIVNGQAYPTMTVDPKAYRFRILSVANGRAFSLGLYEAVDANGVVCDSVTNPYPAIAPAAPGQTTAPAACTELRMVPAATSSNLPASWPTDGRAGGVPDPLTVGPDIIQIGNEGGLLPAPAIWKAQPVTYDMNSRSMTIYNILNHQLLLGAAERADVIVDFSKYAGKTLLLYNDAPAPMPGFDPRIDYYTGEGDQTQAGGSYNTLPGYGPNTRTIMQIKVGTVVHNADGTTSPATPFDLASLQANLPIAYAETQPKPIVPELVYNKPFPGVATQDNYAKIYTGSATAPDFVFPGGEIGTDQYAAGGAFTGQLQNGYMVTVDSHTATVTNPGSGYTSAPTVTIDAPPAGGTQATAKATIDPVAGTVTALTVTNPGSGYLSQPNVTISGGGGAGATATVNWVPFKIHVINKAIQELFDPVYGRMNATLAVELPYSSATIATTIPLAYVDAPIEYYDGIKDGEIQIWKITHNGVDSHPVHFHLVNVQVINRVDWAGVVKPPEPNEVGWKETLRMNPLEDVYVAVKAVHPAVPFGLPPSHRLMDPSNAEGSQLGLTQIDPLTGQAPTYQRQLVNGVDVDVPTTAYFNRMTDFDNEYVWHCHILGHEENDFMRPFIFHPNVLVPDAPGRVIVSGGTVYWVDPTPFGGQDAQGIPTAGTNLEYPEPTSSPKNEVGFKIIAANGVELGRVPANITSWTDTSGADLTGVTVVAYNAAGDSVPGTVNTIAGGGAITATAGGTTVAGIAPGTTTVTQSPAPTSFNQVLNANGTVTFSWAPAAGATAYVITINGIATTVTGLSYTGGVPSNSTVTLAAVDATGATSTAASLYNGAALPPVAVTATAGTGTAAGTVTVSWANNPTNVNNVSNIVASWGNGSKRATLAPTSTGMTISGLKTGTAVSVAVWATSPIGTSAQVTVTATAN